MTLYTKAGGEPAELPFQDLDEAGNAWTNLQDNVAGLEACGWQAAPPVPAYDPAVSKVLWVSPTWAVYPKTPEERAADLEAARQAAIASALEVRQAHEASGCATPYGFIGTDADSQRLIGGAATAAIACGLYSLPFAPVTWTMADGQAVVLSATEAVTVGLLVVAHINACRLVYTSILTALQNSNTIAAVNAVDITAGYPA